MSSDYICQHFIIFKSWILITVAASQ